MNDRRLMLGNEAIARGLLEHQCQMATAYPGTPASEILGAVAALKTEHHPQMHVQWAINEKVALEIAYAGCQSGLRAAVSMKQVGLNVASDPFMSAAYMGVKGGFIVISADDPGPHSSQTEQDSRLFAMLAKVPVLDPDCPARAKDMVGLAFELSEAFEIPVMLRPTTRVCHARQDVPITAISIPQRQPEFEKNPARWAATPKFRLTLHKALEEKLAKIADHAPTAPIRLNPATGGSKAVITSGVAAAHVAEIVKELGLWEALPVFQVLQPFPLHTGFIADMLATYEELLVIEETCGVIEMQLADRNRVKGKLTHHVPRVGELLPEVIEGILADFCGLDLKVQSLPAAPGRRPTLCAGCPHRASFFAVKKAAPKGIYTSDIGCYTLGMNLGAVDTVLCMGAAVSQAAGFYQAHKHLAKPPHIIATIGDSTFFHGGIPALIDARVQRAAFVLLILDNRTTAMTGSQPTPATGVGAAGEPLDAVTIEPLVRGCGIDYCETVDPYRLTDLVAKLKSALTWCRENGPAVVIARRPCLIDKRHRLDETDRVEVRVSEKCDACAYCIQHFECPALVMRADGAAVEIDQTLCSGCGVCVAVCPKKAITIEK